MNLRLFRTFLFSVLVMSAAMFSIDAASAQAITTLAGTYNLSGDTATAISVIGATTLTRDRSGNLYFSVGTNNIACQVYKVDSTGKVTLVAGTGVPGALTGGVQATSASFVSVTGLAVDSSGNLYIADGNESLVLKVTASTGVLSIYGGDGTYGTSGDNGPAASAQLKFPRGLAIDSFDHLYIADYYAQTIRKIDSSGVITTVAGTADTSGPYSSGLLNFPAGIAFDGSANLYVADLTYDVVLKVSGGTLTAVAGNNGQCTNADGIPATSACLYLPWNIAFDSSDNLFISDNGDYAVRKVDPSTGYISTAAGILYTKATSYVAAGPGASAAIGSPQEVVADNSGNLYFADGTYDVIRKINLSGNTLSTVAGNGLAYSGDGGLAAAAQIFQPEGTAVDGSGNIFIADSWNDVVRKVDASTGVISTFAGTGTSGYSGSDPQGLAIDGAGDVYIADPSAHVIFKVAGSSGIISVFAGTGTQGYSGDGGPATAAELARPQGMSFDSSGNLFFTDEVTNAVREVYLADASSPNYGLIQTITGGGNVVNFYSPYGVYADSSGELLISNSITGQVLSLTGGSFASPSSGVLAVVAGTGAPRTFGLSGGTTSAEWNYVSADLTGDLLVTDSLDNVVLKISNVVTPAYTLSLSSSSLTFATQQLSTSTSANKTVTIRNTGVRALAFSSVEVSGANASDFTQTNTCTTSAVAVGSTCTVTVTFAASVSGSESATLTVTDSAGTQTASLSGAGISFSVPGAASGGSTSAKVTSGGTAPYSLQVSVTGGASSSDSLSFSFACSGAPTDAKCTVSPSSITATSATPGAFTVSVATTQYITTASIRKRAQTASVNKHGWPLGVGLAIVPFGLLGVMRKRRKLGCLLLLGLLASLLTVNGCGNSSQKTTTTTASGTPTGTYTLTVTATSGGTSQQSSLTLIVD